MPIGYLLPTLLVAWCTLCAVSPRQWPLGPGQLRYRCAMLLNELPSLGFYWVLVNTASTFAQGQLTTLLGWLGLAVSGLTVAGLGVIVAGQRRAIAAMDAAIDDTVGSPLGARLLLLPSRARRRGVERIADIPYGGSGSTANTDAANTLDVYRVRSGAAARPVLIHLHGGALHSGRKNHEGLPLIYGLALRGWICISANYRLSPAATFPDQLVDVKQVIAWVRSQGGGYRADPDAIFVAGGSAGAQLASLAALTANQPRYQPGFETSDTAVAGAIALYGVYGRRSAPGVDVHSDALPARHLNADAPPFLIVHGEADTVLAVEGARDFVAGLRDVSSTAVAYAELPGTQHSFDMFRSPRSVHLVTVVDRFAEHVLHGQPLAQSGTTEET